MQLISAETDQQSVAGPDDALGPRRCREPWRRLRASLNRPPCRRRSRVRPTHTRRRCGRTCGGSGSPGSRGSTVPWARIAGPAVACATPAAHGRERAEQGKRLVSDSPAASTSAGTSRCADRRAAPAERFAARVGASGMSETPALENEVRSDHSFDSKAVKATPLPGRPVRGSRSGRPAMARGPARQALVVESAVGALRRGRTHVSSASAALRKRLLERAQRAAARTARGRNRHVAVRRGLPLARRGPQADALPGAAG